MTVAEVFTEISKHMIKGMMTHEQLANYYDFLGLCGYKRCHEYHYLSESCKYRDLCNYYITTHNMLIPESEVENPKVIPRSWYSTTRQKVDNTTKRNAIKSGLDAWVTWEYETKSLYETMWKELIEQGEISDAMKVQELLCDVNEELGNAERYALNLKAEDYDLGEIFIAQEEEHEQYKHMLKEIGEMLC